MVNGYWLMVEMILGAEGTIKATKYRTVPSGQNIGSPYARQGSGDEQEGDGLQVMSELN
ncbi:hypothetical protein DSECCO2_641810 [anaerobic digester metagenome]